MFLENPVNHNEQFGWIEVICGSMFSGKTEELIRRLKRAQLAKQKIEIFKPLIDQRFDNNLVTSHDANQIHSKDAWRPTNTMRKTSGRSSRRQPSTRRQPTGASRYSWRRCYPS